MTMNKQRGFFKSTNGIDDICYYKFLPEGEVRGVFQIVHGMAEHAGRYEGFAGYLCDRGFAVYAHEHVGHGGSVKDEARLGIFGDGDSSVMVGDVRKMCCIAREENPGRKLILLGHSMGSFVSRIFASENGSMLDGFVISGTGCANPAVKAALALVKVMKIFKGKDFRSVFMNKMAFGKYNDRYETHRTEFDWLTRDEKIVDDYIASPYCGFIFSLNGMEALLELNGKSNRPETFQKTRKDLPIYIVSGCMDPVGNFGEGVKKVYADYKAGGKKNIEMKLYPESRHELINEFNKSEVFDDILTFALRIVGSYSTV